MVLLAYGHGLRASELCDLCWDQVDFNRAVLHIRRVKQGTPATHPLTGLEMRALRKLQREFEASPFVFVSERGAPFSTVGFARMLERAAETAGLEIKAHPHMLRHACGFKLANDGSILGPCRLISATRAFSIRCATRNSRLRGSRIFGGTHRV
jgi:integrase